MNHLQKADEEQWSGIRQILNHDVNVAGGFVAGSAGSA
jgi:hypothetical protein